MPDKNIESSESTAIPSVAQTHQMLLDKFVQKMCERVRKKYYNGERIEQMFGIIMDLDDQVWRQYFNLGEKIAPPNPSSSTGKIKRVLCHVFQRRQVQQLIDHLTDFADCLKPPPTTGCIYVLVLAKKMASPFTIHWASELELDWGE
ncbi:MAG: hypothetical protein V1738_04405 [Patescibacteria group bacterium]